MTIVAEEYGYVFGVDTHARTHTYAIVDTSTGVCTATESFPTTAAAIDALEAARQVLHRQADRPRTGPFRMRQRNNLPGPIDVRQQGAGVAGRADPGNTPEYREGISGWLVPVPCTFLTVPVMQGVTVKHCRRRFARVTELTAEDSSQVL
jgi:hypothetical protein